jgi:hypothetical protein
MHAILVSSSAWGSWPGFPLCSVDFAVFCARTCLPTKGEDGPALCLVCVWVTCVGFHIYILHKSTELTNIYTHIVRQTQYIQKAPCHSTLCTVDYGLSYLAYAVTATIAGLAPDGECIWNFRSYLPENALHFMFIAKIIRNAMCGRTREFQVLNR